MTPSFICGIGPLGFAIGTPQPEPAKTVTERTPEEARAWLDYQGITIAQWAREHGMHHSLVREVLAGRKKCLRGMSHNIAVLLGMKRGQLTTRPARVAPAQRAAAQHARVPVLCPAKHVCATCNGGICLDGGFLPRQRACQ